MSDYNKLNIALIGSSGHAFVIADSILELKHSIIGYYDKNESRSNYFNLKYLGNDSEISNSKNYTHFIAIGDNLIRRKIGQLLKERKCLSTSIFHPKSSVSNLAKIESLCFIATNSIINAFAFIDEGCIINSGAIIEHECKIQQYSHIAPGAVLAGNVCVGQNTFVGANSVIKQGVNIGNNVIVGAGSVVINDIPDNETWVGNPAKCIKK